MGLELCFSTHEDVNTDSRVLFNTEEKSLHLFKHTPPSEATDALYWHHPSALKCQRHHPQNAHTASTGKVKRPCANARPLRNLSWGEVDGAPSKPNARVRLKLFEVAQRGETFVDVDRRSLRVCDRRLWLAAFCKRLKWRRGDETLFKASHLENQFK